MRNRVVEALEELLEGERSAAQPRTSVVERCIQHDQGKGNDVTHF